MRSYSCFNQSIEKEKCGEWSPSSGGGGGGSASACRGGDDIAAVAAGDDDGDIWLFFLRKGLGCLAYVATAKPLEASSRKSPKMNGGRYKRVLLLLSLKKQDR